MTIDIDRFRRFLGWGLIILVACVGVPLLLSNLWWVNDPTADFSNVSWIFGFIGGLACFAWARGLRKCFISGSRITARETSQPGKDFAIPQSPLNTRDRSHLSQTVRLILEPAD